MLLHFPGTGRGQAPTTNRAGMGESLQSWMTFYDRCEFRWHSLRASRLTSNLVVVAFVGGIGVTLLSHFRLIPFVAGRFFAIELAFGVLLLAEVIGLVFTLAHSVADSVGKQFEIVSLILLRNSFKELGHLPLETTWSAATAFELLPLLTDALGAVVVFLITGWFYRAQKHVRITSSAEEQLHFIVLKKLVAVALLAVFGLLGLYALLDFCRTSHYHNLFNLYYTILIFTDVLILIISLRYSNLYLHLFRYSSFALATVVLRLSLSAPKYYNVLLSVAAGVFVLLVANAYNVLNRGERSGPA